MNRSRFDPFRNRLARDIRNSLSRSFLKSLAEKNMSPLERTADGYLQQHLEPVYEGYILERLKQYNVFFTAIDAGENRELLQQAAILWDLELYFELHEFLEPAWKDAEGAWRKALQGLIRAAGVKIHAEYNNRAAVSMSAKALKDLKRFGDTLKGFDKLDAVLAELEEISPPSHGTCPEN